MFIGSLDPVSNKATWTVFYELRDADTDELIDLSDADEITVAVRDPQSCTEVLSGTLTDDTIAVTDTGVFRWSFTASEMSALRAKTYEVGCTIEQDDETVQLVIGSLPVMDGVVS